MSFDFKKLGLDRIATSIASSVNTPGSGRVATGDITRGEVVEVTHGSSTTPVTESTTKVKSRRTGAIPIEVQLTNVADQMNWYIEGTTLYVQTDSGYGTLKFWVF